MPSRPQRLSVIVVAALAVATNGCSSHETPETPAPTATRVATFEPGALIVAGHAGRVAAWGYTFGVAPHLGVYHQDASNPGLLVRDTSLPGCNCNARYVTLNDQWIAVAGEEWIGTSALRGFVQLAPTAGPYATAASVYPAGWTAVDRATAWGDRLVAVLGQTVRVYDISDLGAPSLVAESSMSEPSTAIEAAGGGVFIFGANGYAFVDLATGTLIETLDARFAGVERAVESGGKLHTGGASSYVGYYRIATFDPSGAPTLAMEANADRIADGSANIGEMSFDASTGEFILLRTKPYSMSPPGAGSTDVLRYAFDAHGG